MAWWLQQQIYSYPRRASATELETSVTLLETVRNLKIVGEFNQSLKIITSMKVPGLKLLKLQTPHSIDLYPVQKFCENSVALLVIAHVVEDIAKQLN